MKELLLFFKEYIHIAIPIAMFLTVIVVGLLVTYYSKKNSLLRVLKKSRRRPISRVSDNEYAKIIAEVTEVQNPLIAPLSKQNCVYYRVIVEVKHGKNWKKIIDDENFQDFYLEHNSEIAKVKLSNLSEQDRVIYVVQNIKGNLGYRNDAKEEIKAYLEEHNKHHLAGKALKYSEQIILCNEALVVKGVGKWESLNQPIDGYSYSRILVLSGDKKQKLLITNESKAFARVNNKF